MYIKLMGAFLILAGCGGYGIMMAVHHRREVTALHQLVFVMEKMICELEYRLTPLPDLCRFGAQQTSGALGKYLAELARTLDTQVSPDVEICSATALKSTPGLPGYATAQLQILSQTLGRFDLAGQISGLQSCKQSCLAQLEILEHQQTQRLRSYQTLGFCAGAALAILLF